jgi:23S rRNA (cytidine1920-2'-O)/16S rRNA (cytidine1409-2'-O)-methyltransferase
VYGIDVGYGQTAWTLRQDPRVILRERTNLRRLTPEDLYGPGDPLPDLAVADLSFISLELVLPALLALLKPGGTSPGLQHDLVLLVKPQFQVGRARVGKGGVVRDPQAHQDAIWGVASMANSLGLKSVGLVASPITGPAGNHEYLLWLQDGARGRAEPADSQADELGQKTIEAVVAQTLRD